MGAKIGEEKQRLDSKQPAWLLIGKEKKPCLEKKRQTKVYRCHSADSYYEQSIQIVYSINNVPICTIFVLGFNIKIYLCWTMIVLCKVIGIFYLISAFYVGVTGQINPIYLIIRFKWLLLNIERYS